MVVQPHTLSLITTHQCTAACDHCCFTCSPKVEKRIPTPSLHRYIDQAKDFGTFQVVVFTGGECFLLGDDLDDLVGHASSAGFKTRFVSNGYWAVSPERARKRLQRLIDRGLTEANFSTGDAHAKYVPPERVRYGAVAAAELGLTTVVVVELFEKSQFDFDGFVAVEGVRTQTESGRLTVKLSPWMPFEGQERLTYGRAYLNEVPRLHSPGCTTALRVLAVNPDEHLIACCGLALEEIEELHLGDLRQHTIGEILARTPDDFIKIWIHLHGPDAVIRHAQRFDPTIQKPDGMAHICDACRFMYHNERVRRVVLEHPPENREEILREYYDSLLLAPYRPDPDFAVRLHNTICSVDRMKEVYRLATKPIVVPVAA